MLFDGSIQTDIERKEEAFALKKKQSEEEIRRLTLENDLFKQDIDAKKDFFRFIKLLTVAWSAAIWLTLYFVGTHHFFPKRK